MCLSLNSSYTPFFVRFITPFLILFIYRQQKKAACKKIQTAALKKQKIQLHYT